jgi:hypothetical protein
VVQAPAPERVIAGGLATLAVLGQVLVSKYCDPRRSIGSRRSLPATASISRVRRSPDGSAAPAGGLRRCMSAWLKTYLPPTICLPTKRRSRCSIPAADERRLDGLWVCAREQRA